MLPDTPQWEPRAFYGALGVVTAFFGYFFLAVAKKYLARGANTAMPNYKHPDK